MGFKVRRAAVLGAGVMGAQIAAYLAARGVRTYLLDLASEKPPEDPALQKVVGKNFRNTAAIKAIENLKRLKPSPLLSDSVLANLIPGNFDDDMSVLSEVDWVIEAVIENLPIKKKIIRQIAQNAPQHIPISTNTSGLPLKKLCEDEDEFFQKRFFGTHFFNPPRYMKLLEIVPHANNDKNLVKEVADWAEKNLGKGIVYTNDTTNFIANRIGVFSMFSTLHYAEELGLNIETVDALTGPLIGRPSSATFRTADVVGLDTLLHVAKNVYENEPSDPFHRLYQPTKALKQLVEQKHLGQKSSDTGFFKKTREGGKTKILVYRPETNSYVDQTPETFPWMEKAFKERDMSKRLEFIFSHNDKGAEFLWRLFRDVFAYSALLLNEIANDNFLSVDDAMRWGFNWQVGPFALWQGIGYNKVLERMQKEDVKLPAWAKKDVQFYKPAPTDEQWQMGGAKEQLEPSTNRYRSVPQNPHIYNLPRSENKADKRVVLSNPNASLVDVGHGIAALVFHSKANALNSAILELTMKSIDKVNKDFDGLVVANEGEHFSAGADLKEVLQMIDAKEWSKLEQYIKSFQGAMTLLKYAPFPSVAAVHGMALGGGCEFSLQTSRQILAGEAYCGLVEMGVGVIPAGGGLKELALRAYAMAECGDSGDAMPFLQRAFSLVGMAKVSGSGLEAIEMGLYPQTATMSIARDYLVDRAKGMVLEMLNRGYAPPTPKQAIKVLGDPGIQTFNMALYNMKEARRISEHDALIAEKIVTVLCGGEIDAGEVVNEAYLLDLERNGFVELCQTPKTRERIEAMLKTGKPLRN